MAEASLSGRPSAELKDALRKARAAEAAHYEAVYALNDARHLRLQVLKDELSPFFADASALSDTIELVLVPSDPPRLWLDLVTSIIMEPDPRTYRLVQDRQGTRETLLETENRQEVVKAVRQHIAHRIIERQRQLSPVRLTEVNGPRFSSASLVLAWIAGFALGALGLLGLGIYLKFLQF